MKSVFVRPPGSDVQILTIKGDRHLPEPSMTVVRFPGGHVEISRCSDETYWIHTTINHPEAGDFVPGETVPGELLDAVIHQKGKHSVDSNLGDFGNSGTYDVAIRVGVRKGSPLRPLRPSVQNP
jgi:hypothetical protein